MRDDDLNMAARFYMRKESAGPAIAFWIAISGAGWMTILWAVGRVHHCGWGCLLR